MKKRRTWMILLMILICIMILAAIHPIVLIQNNRLRKAILGIEGTTVHLNDVVPFEWDALYTADPYEPKDSIEQRIGIKSSAIRENQINEGMVHLIFVKGDTVVASILGYPENLGYAIRFTGEERISVTSAEEAVFEAAKKDHVVTLSYLASNIQ